jgi:23S rRNA (cytidine2498-2'-O)-methyltransferase
MTSSISSHYIYVACQHGAETTIKTQLCMPNGPYRLAFSQKGFVTLKSELKTPAWSTALPEGPLIRSRGHVLHRFEGENASELIAKTLDAVRGSDWESLHVWQRDISVPGWHDFEPGRSALAELIASQFRASLESLGDRRATNINSIVHQGTKLLEVILVDPNRWWIAARPVQTTSDSWPGGTYAVPIPENMISRAYLKIAEAIPWSGIAIRPGDKVVEIGSSPGGACQRLLDLGAVVTGVDPADMDESIVQHPNFTHWRSKSLQVKRKLFRPFRILVCDANVAPNYTLDTVESIVTYPTNRFRSLLLTLKLSSWQAALDIPEHLARVRSWGFDRVEARQLAHNRREYCLAAEKTESKSSALSIS